MNKIIYSIIIPHKNIPDLLTRCLDSIPVRDDIQVIVVDDNSDSEIVDFDNFPQWRGENYEYYLTKEGKGAGYARNVGVEHAKGEWLLFADADDKFVTANFSRLLDSPKDNYDVICWPTDIKKTDGTIVPYTPSWRSGKSTFNLNFYGQYKIYDNYIPDILYVLYEPWHKMIKRSVILKKSISYTEIPTCDDIYFSTCLATQTTNIGVFSDVVYTYIRRTTSISEVNSYIQKGTQRLECHLKELFKVQRLLKKQNKERYVKSDLEYVFNLLESRSIQKAIIFCLIQMKDVSPILGFRSLRKHLTYQNTKILFSSFFKKLFHKKSSQRLHLKSV